MERISVLFPIFQQPAKPPNIWSFPIVPLNLSLPTVPLITLATKSSFPIVWVNALLVLKVALVGVPRVRITVSLGSTVVSPITENVAVPVV